MSETANYIVELKTNDTKKVLIFENWECNDELNGYNVDVRVSSFDFSAKQRFLLYKAGLEQFLRELEKMISRLSGSIELRDEFPEPYVKMEIDNLGHVNITGELWDHSQREQHLKFGFKTDQTCLRPLFNDLSRVINDLRSL
jgi:hypothetical protein